MYVLFVKYFIESFIIIEDIFDWKPFFVDEIEIGWNQYIEWYFSQCVTATMKGHPWSTLIATRSASGEPYMDESVRLALFGRPSQGLNVILGNIVYQKTNVTISRLLSFNMNVTSL